MQNTLTPRRPLIPRRGLEKRDTWNFWASEECDTRSEQFQNVIRRSMCTLEAVVGTSPTAAMYVLPIVLIFSISL